MRPDDTPELPPEVIDLIIDNLSSSDDEDTLKACSIVSSSFRDSAQKRLFSSIDIHTSPAAAHRNNRLFEVLASNPRICTFIQSLFILVVEDASDTVLGNCLNLPNLGSITIWDGSMPNVEEGISWTRLSNTFRTDLLQLLQLPTVQSLSLFPMSHFPINILRYCSSLRSLKVTGPALITFRTRVEFDTTSVSLPFVLKGMDGERGYLRDLSVYESYISDQIQSVLDHPDSRLSLSRLRTYSNQLISDDTDHDYSQAILQLSSSSLEEVQLEYVQLMSEPYPDLSQLHNLRVLRLHTNNLDTPLVAIHALGSVACSNTLSEVYLQVDAPLSWSGPDRDEWRQLDEVLARERHALHLQLLHLDVDTPIMRMDEDWEYHVRDAMPKLSSAGRLHFGDFQGAPPLHW